MQYSEWFSMAFLNDSEWLGMVSNGSTILDQHRRWLNMSDNGCQMMTNNSAVHSTQSWSVVANNKPSFQQFLLLLGLALDSKATFAAGLISL